jgi:hypothetical protein
LFWRIGKANRWFGEGRQKYSEEEVEDNDDQLTGTVSKEKSLNADG